MTEGTPPLAPAGTLRQGALGVGAITFFVVSAAGPLVAVAGGAPIGMMLGNGPGMPLGYILVSLILLAFAVGYTAMAARVRNAGGFYAFAAEGLGPVAGGAAAMIALLAYNTMQIGIYGMFGVASSALVADLLHMQPPWWACAYAAMAVVALCGYRQIDVSAKVLGVLVVAEYLCVLALDAVILARGGDVGVSLHAFTPAAFSVGAPAIGLLFCFASFIGFEATTIYAEEAKDPRHSVPRATYFSVLLIGGFYAFTIWCMVVGLGDAKVIPAIQALADPTQLLFVLSDRYAAPPLTLALRILFVTSVFAGLLAFHNAVARYFFALGRDGVLPRELGVTHPRHFSPHLGSLVQSALAALVVGLFAAGHADPLLTLFSWLTNVGTLGVLALMALASFAVPAYFRRHPGHGESPLVVVILPVAAGLALAGAMLLAAANFDLLTGASKELAIALPLTIVAAAALGAVLTLVRKPR
jgi:amino acid transporter